MFTDPSEMNSSLTAPPLQQRPPDLQLQNQPHLPPRSNNPSDSLPGPSTSPPSSDTRQKGLAQGHSLTAPMVEVMGPNGPNLVFRSCTSHDIEECAKLLPDLSQSGDVFSTNFSDFCKEYRPTGAEIRRILTRKITASDIAKIHNKLPVANLRLKHEDWDHVSNMEYRNAVDVLAVAIKKEFPRKINMTNIYACKQKGDEDTNDFITRVIEAVTKYSGIETPTEVGDPCL
ncbi:hypothetical protein GOODEAATRI_026492 [Goodea atripinnis]|uniref:Uncharacterized protein n=1 Tax=Goodea atripinnis TaxID=208336 RepID=A0ABV0P7Y9_9TELE